jgi:nucleoside-diphosphate-sugar epimerase
MERYAQANGIPWIKFAKGDRKIDVSRPYLAAAGREGRPGVVAIGVAQEFFGTDNRHAIGKARHQLGYTPRITLRDGVRLAAAWYRTQRQAGASSVPLSPNPRPAASGA